MNAYFDIAVWRILLPSDYTRTGGVKFFPQFSFGVDWNVHVKKPLAVPGLYMANNDMS